MIDNKMNDTLLSPFTRQEVEKAIAQMFPTKTLGLDGYPALFYQCYWEIMGQNTISNCLNILNKRVSIKEWNTTNIVLISKTKKSNSCGRF